MRLKYFLLACSLFLFTQKTYCAFPAKINSAQSGIAYQLPIKKVLQEHEQFEKKDKKKKVSKEKKAHEASKWALISMASSIVPYVGLIGFIAAPFLGLYALFRTDSNYSDRIIGLIVTSIYILNGLLLGLVMFLQ